MVIVTHQYSYKAMTTTLLSNFKGQSHKAVQQSLYLKDDIAANGCSSSQKMLVHISPIGMASEDDKPPL